MSDVLASWRLRGKSGLAGTVVRALIGSLAVLALGAGCAQFPTAGVPADAAVPAGPGGSSRPGSNCCGLIMTGPQPDWSPSEVVSNFLLAGADFTNNHAVARKYLTSAASKAWHPGPGPAVTVVAQTPAVTESRRPPASQGTWVVQIAAQELGVVNGSGQYIPVQHGQQTLRQVFSLQQVGHQWRIAALPYGGIGQQSSRELLLTKDLFQIAYQPRDLYYLAYPTGKVLVPDPVFEPTDAADPNTELVHALLGSPHGWLAGAASSAAPPGTWQRHPVMVPAGTRTAIVDLGMPPREVSSQTLNSLAAELVWTLTSAAYGSQPIQSVRLVVNGHPWSPLGHSDAVLNRTEYPQPALDLRGSQSLYYLTSHGAARMINKPGGPSLPVPGAASTGQVALTSLAVSADQRHLAGIATPSAGGPATLYTSGLPGPGNARSEASGALVARLTGSRLTAVAWDASDNLWFAGTLHGQTGLWVLPTGADTPTPVTIPAGTGRITALRVAPDGVRVAMIAGSGLNAHLMLAAIIRTSKGFLLSPTGPIGADLHAPSALSWYDADHLLVVNQSPAGSQLEEVPVNGDQSTFRGIELGMVSVAASGSRNYLYAGLQTGRLARSLGLAELWVQSLAGRSATYPG